ncbi:unnamed protein product, partial [Ixodes pacificus]
MGRAVGRRTLLHPLETLFLVESGQLTLKRDGVPVSLPEAYELLLDGRDDMDQYRVYAHLLRAGYVVLLPRRHLLPRNVSPCRDWYHLDPRHWEGPPRDPWGSPQTGQQGPWPGRDNQHWAGPPRHPWGSQEDNRQLWGDWRGGDRWERGGRGWRRVPWNDRRTWAPFRGPPLQQDSRGHWRDNGQAPPQRPHRGHRPAPQDDGYPSALPPLPQGSAHSWSQLKGGLAGAQRTRALLGGEGALLWRGPIKPLVLPSRDLSLG